MNSNYPAERFSKEYYNEYVFTATVVNTQYTSLTYLFGKVARIESRHRFTRDDYKWLYCANSRM